MKPVTQEQIKLMQAVADSLYNVSVACSNDENFWAVMNDICPKYNLVTMSIDELAGEWEVAIQEVKDTERKQRQEATKLLPFLNDIAEHNRKCLDEEGEMPNDAKTFTFEHDGCDIYDCFADETLRSQVQPTEYYPIESLKKVVGQWLLSGWSI
jgi:hypothetical protein